MEGVPHLGYPGQTWPGGLPKGYPTLGTPCQTWPWGTPTRGYPTLGAPPVGPGQGDPDRARGGTPPRVVLDRPRSVCLLRSRRRTFLFKEYICRLRFKVFFSLNVQKFLLCVCLGFAILWLSTARQTLPHVEQSYATKARNGSSRQCRVLADISFNFCSLFKVCCN